MFLGIGLVVWDHDGLEAADEASTDRRSAWPEGLRATKTSPVRALSVERWVPACAPAGVGLLRLWPTSLCFFSEKPPVKAGSTMRGRILLPAPVHLLPSEALPNPTRRHHANPASDFCLNQGRCLKGAAESRQVNGLSVLTPER